MTVSSTTTKVSYSGNGSTVAFAVSFYFLDNTHLKVVKRSALGIETTLTYPTDYSVTGAGVPAGGTVTLNVAPLSGETLVIARNAPLTQLVDYQTNDPFPANTHEMALDKLTMELQQVQEQVDRSVKVSISDTTSPDALIASVVNSATSASNSATEALGYLNTFKSQYYGVYSADPTVDPLGASRTIGDLYYNSSSLKLKIFDGSAWVDTAAASPVTLTTQTFSGNGSTTAFTLSATPSYLASVEVFISGVRQVPTTVYTVSGTTLTFTSAPPTGTNNIFVRWMSTIAVGVPNDASVSTAKIVDSAVTYAKIQSVTAGKMLGRDSSGAGVVQELPISVDTNGNVTTTGAGGSYSDPKGELRAIPQNSQTGAYVLVASDHGKHISITTGGVTVPSAIFSVGQSVVIFNNSASNQTITQGASVTMYNGADGTSGNRTLGARGIATVLCVATNTFVITGAGLT